MLFSADWSRQKTNFHGDAGWIDIGWGWETLPETYHFAPEYQWLEDEISTWD